MIEHLGHVLIKHESAINNHGIEYYCFKCKKCNRLIFYYAHNTLFWGYLDGLDYDNERLRPWEELRLTCEELMIKRLLE
jgi:hypothetical protein